MGIPAPDAVVYLSVEVEVSQRLIAERYHGDTNKMDIQEKDVEYLARSRAAAEYCARKLDWERIVCTKEENGQRVMRSADEIHAEVMDRLAGLV